MLPYKYIRMLPLIVNRFLVYASLETYTVRTSVKFYPIYVNLTKFLCTSPDKNVFLYIEIV